MKTILLFRHGKSDWKAEYEQDHERPLSGRGRRASRTMGQFLARAGQTPDRVISSSALRARSTLMLASAAGEWTAPIYESKSLYLCSVDDVLEVLRKESDDFERIMFVGHEPTCSELLESLTGVEAKIPTGAMARIDSDIRRWKELEPGSCRLIWLVPPKLYTKGEFDFVEKKS